MHRRMSLLKMIGAVVSAGLSLQVAQANDDQDNVTLYYYRGAEVLVFQFEGRNPAEGEHNSVSAKMAEALFRNAGSHKDCMFQQCAYGPALTCGKNFYADEGRKVEYSNCFF